MSDENAATDEVGEHRPRRGAPPDNRNNLKHGFYGKKILPEAGI